METKAVAKFIRVSARKVRIVAEHIRGQKAEQAINLLTFSPQRAGQLLLKVVKSAVANAEQNQNADVDKLFVKRVMIDEGPSLKRFRPRAQGRAFRIKKRSSHITVVLDQS